MRGPETLELPAAVRAEVQELLEEARSRGTELSGELSAALDEARIRGGAAWDALRGERVGPPVAVRRWPVALTAALLGAAAGAAVAYLLRRLSPADAPDAQEPEELVAVVDRAV